MDRALNLDTLATALGSHERLPSPAELQQLLAQTEIGLFTRQADIDEQLLETAWYLQSVATAREDLQLVDVARRRRAHQVAGHIFDLWLQSQELSRDEQLRYTFAAQVGYLGGELTPNAAAIARRAPLPATPFEWSDSGIVSMEAGILLLALNRARLYPLLTARRGQLDGLSQQLGDLTETVHAAVNGVVRGSWDMTNYLTYGRQEALEGARRWFRTALENEHSAGDVDSRWVAAHLLEIVDGLAESSVWGVLPPDMPSVARAMTLGDPPVLSLWPPQLSFLKPDSTGLSPLHPTVKRLVLSFPTSAGKTLLAQLFVMAHLVSATSDVCVVAPTHSLCRELASSLERRVRTLGYQLSDDGPLGFFNSKPPGARVVVMTPEKLAARLRSDPAGLLEDFGLFVVDEAHLVADAERGWRLEATISILHHLTRGTDHRILVLSATLGNQVHVVGWIDEGSGVISRHETWRGPRRLNVVFTTEPEWEKERIEPAQGTRQPRTYVPLQGALYLKTGAGDVGFVRGRFSESVGTLVRRRQRDGEWVRDGILSSRQRAELVPLISHVSASGPVLVVEATRNEAQLLAEEVAERLGEGQSAPAGLLDLVRARLGPDHPLARVVERGVAFHHSALPIDVQSEVEDAVRRGDISCLVATTTLTEGVNLPFKTVIIGHRGFRDSEGEVEVIDASRLLNAIGRAGRAGRETEGWLILAEHSQFHPGMFDDLERTGEDIEMVSTLASGLAIEALAGFEASARAGEDVIFSNREAIVDGFISYVWFVADALIELRGSATEQALHDAVKDTFAWQQLSSDAREQLLRVTTIALNSFFQQPEDRRGRWARSGTSLATAAALDAIAEDVASAARARAEPLTLLDSLALILDEGRLNALLGLAENRAAGFKARRNAPRDEVIEVDMVELLRGWVSGRELQDLADEYLRGVEKSDYRYGQLADFSATVFEHHLPWTIGTVIAWVNTSLEAGGHEARLADALPGAIHYGVGTSDALELMLGGVRSRRLANRVSAARQGAGVPIDQETLREWLADLDIGAWRRQFDASPTELLDLLKFVRAPEARLVNEVLEGNGYTLPFTSRSAVDDGSEARIEREPGQPDPAPLAVIVGSEIVGTIGAEHHEDVALLVEIGIPLGARISSDDDGHWMIEIRVLTD